MTLDGFPPLDDSAIKAWMEVAVGRRPLPKSFRQFIALWEAFNRFYRIVYPLGGDSAAVRAISSDSLVRRAWGRLRKSSRFRRKVERLASHGPIPDMRGPIASTTGSAVIIDNRDLTEVLNYIYRIRCNLFHGGKRPGDRGDMEITEWAQDVLGPLLSEIVATPA